ncbi:MAG: hypothetical protein NZ789_00185, partial [Pseudomonadales bacterium]|nr:hypothetical protein [Pseudomonadales bacterium]
MRSCSLVSAQRIVVGLCLTFLNPAVVATPIDAERQWIRIAMTQEPPNLNSIRSTDLVSYFLIGHFQEGLLRYDRRGRLPPGVAESWTVEELKLTFRLRPE